MASRNDCRSKNAPVVVDFTSFPRLPAELRVQVWRQTFNSRVLELHYGGEPWNHFLAAEAQWYSSCGNPVALSVSTESRREALSFYTVALPLGGHRNSTRRLFINPAIDTLVLLGADVAYGHLMRLFSDVMAMDPAGRGLRRLGLTITAWNRGWASAVRQQWCKAPFGDLDEFLVLIYGESRPPVKFQGGECALKHCAGMKLFLDCTAGAGSTPQDGLSCEGCNKTRKHIVYVDFIRNSWTH
ncbi:hypothetical protein PFICI_10723 [Pestalotiopsis fici W106-1]|uniref:2EXR domain-containing protein n=1 Tax=Pestalotiopsis fici (strain W106-1 / CGMCC3.15140) TaxID=1229662 RepID=W3WSR4_PESFW|nr:uncharacterized protein PFICI_10723 [Pestalotiopsis fici W106-1]ETS76849.1 hypothetical protein PFICI_10723 [Pestalotiopsis fici W106-1]